MGRKFLGGDRKLSRQLRYQIRMQEVGRCRECGKVAVSKAFCPVCLIKYRKIMREKLGCNKWRLGGKGRPPLMLEDEFGAY